MQTTAIGKAAIGLIGLVLAAGLAGQAHAGSYPVSGKWTYDNVAEDGPAKDCGRRFMNFQGDRRFDTGGGVPGYHNLSVEKDGSAFHVVDQFSTGQITARSNYTLRLLDDDHIELHLSTGAKIIKLRRCE